jgi:hypothetical protein
VRLEEEERERNRKKPKTYGQMVLERLTGSQEGRIDCMLQVRKLRANCSLLSFCLAAAVRSKLESFCCH